MIKIQQTIVLIIFSFAFLILGGCAKSVEVATEFPAPLMEPYPLIVGVRYPSELTDFVHIEDPELQAEWTIKLGTANLRMFRTLLDGMFVEVIELDGDAAAAIDPRIDLILEPKLEELEFSVPQQSGTDQFVVWLRYNLKLLRPDEQLLGDWRITGYGQEDQGNMGMGSEDAMKDAAIKALRDAGANIIIGFPEAPGIRPEFLPEPEPEIEAEAAAEPEAVIEVATEIETEAEPVDSQAPTEDALATSESTMTEDPATKNEAAESPQ